MQLFTAIFISICSFLSASPSYCTTVAILGDSLSTGAGTHPNFKYEPTVFWDILEARNPMEIEPLNIFQNLNIPQPLQYPTMLWPTPREFQGSLEWLGIHLKRSFSLAFLNEPRYSWGFLVGQHLGATAQNILIAAENGSKIDALPTQIDRVLFATQNQLPDKVFIFYTGNDLCAPHHNFITKTDDFKETINNGLHYLISNSTTPPEGSDVYIVGMAPVQQLVSSPSILEKSVNAYGLATTCKKLREESYRPDGWLQSSHNLPGAAMYLRDFIPPNPAVMCPTLFGLPKEVEKNLSMISGRLRNYRKVSKEAAELAQTQAETQQKNIRFHWINTTSEMNLESHHIANDCFHLNAHGQSYLAKTILEGIN